MQEPVDLTGDSDSDDAADSKAQSAPGREDLLRATQSESTAIDATDLDGADLESLQLSPEHPPRRRSQPCEFLETAWVGANEDVRRICSSPSETGIDSAAYIARGGGSVYASGIGSFIMSPSDLQTLQGSSWLNDEIVNAYMCVLKIRNDKDLELPRCHFFNSFFYALLRNAKGLNYKTSRHRLDYKTMSRWTRSSTWPSSTCSSSPST